METDQDVLSRRRVSADEIRSPPPKKANTVRPAPVKFYLPLNLVLTLLVISHTISALYAPILDCDETYNYWEPLHYLTHGSGLQTWEYSPDYALRSWAYIALHAFPVKVISLFTSSKTSQFCALRCLLGLVSAFTETSLYSAISRTLNPRIGVFYFLAILFTPGIFHASTAFLPSSFAMYTSTLALTSFLTPSGLHGPHTARGIMWFGIGALLGWPFAGALIIPFMLEEWFAAFIVDDLFATFRRYLDGIVRCLIILILQSSIDTFFYRKFVVVPFRLVLYNVFPSLLSTNSDSQARGPDIFGTEPWHFYLRNLLLNFNLFFILALASFPLLLIQSHFLRQRTTKQTLLRTAVFLTPFYLWLTIFTLQPHKEERFIYPAYPFVALNASISLHLILSWLGQSKPKTIIGKIPPQLKLALVLPIIAGSLVLSVLRTLGTVTAYNAPLTIYSHLHRTSTGQNPTSSISENICFGKDWYRFPTTFLLPSSPTTIHPRFILSSFNGLLPGPFSTASSGISGFFPGAYLIPSGMNDLNQFDPGKVIDIKHCQYLVDTYTPGMEATEREPLYINDISSWEEVHCEPFLDAAETSLVGRMIWLPNSSAVPERFRRRWGQHCLLRRRRKP